jgi:hypothetical protein
MSHLSHLIENPLEIPIDDKPEENSCCYDILNLCLVAYPGLQRMAEHAQRYDYRCYLAP